MNKEEITPEEKLKQAAVKYAYETYRITPLKVKELFIEIATSEAAREYWKRDDYEKEMFRIEIARLQEEMISISGRIMYTEAEKEKYWQFECECGFSGYSVIASGGGQIADTGDYDDCRCPSCLNIID